ncbi:Raftlin-2 [Saguinus oedipus]|uniref:Raftlin-2 n=1 Tax=Saguinus oedipus TaxID=9490 RepID=A0ABQ9VHK0_SAGOE|nr:Raftlin-2 [Saguinus oedipus]
MGECTKGLFEYLVKSIEPRYFASDNKLYTVFNVFDDDSASRTYQEGILSMKVTRKGSVISTLDADWLELTTFYYKQGLSLIDSFVFWETSKAESEGTWDTYDWEHLPKSLEGFFIYEEEGSGVPGSSRKGNDAIVVEQWTVIEGCEIKTDYGPLLHTLAEFGWLLTSVLPTPVLRHDSTKIISEEYKPQVVVGKGTLLKGYSEPQVTLFLLDAQLEYND